LGTRELDSASLEEKIQGINLTHQDLEVSILGVNSVEGILSVEERGRLGELTKTERLDLENTP
jgi:hypothetical protein